MANGEAFGSDRGRYHRQAGGPGLQDLQAGAAARKQGHDSDAGARQFRNRIVHRPDDRNACVALDMAANCRRIPADQPPNERRPTFAEKRPDLAAKEADSGEVRMVFHVTGEDDGFFIGVRRTRYRRQGVGVDGDARAGSDGVHQRGILIGSGQHQVKSQEPGAFQLK